ncbi:MAG: hypothetical protein ABIP55_15315 [Tepidisphaeraceae bacterium]
MNPAGKWIIFLVAFEDDDFDPLVLKERIAIEEDEHLAAFLRGGELLTVLSDDDEETAEAYRREFEKQCLR